MSSLPDSWMKSAPHASRCAETRARLPVASLTATTVSQLGQSRHRLDRDVGDRPRRDIIEDDRDPDLGDRGEMGVDPLLVGAIVIRRDVEGGACSNVLRHPRQVEGVGGIVGSAAGDDRHPARARPRRQARSAAAAPRRTASRPRPWSRTAPARRCLRRPASRQSLGIALHRLGPPQKGSQARESTRKT